MSKITGNEPAFPIYDKHAFSGDLIGTVGGLTIRQHFAAMAMQGLLSNTKGLDFAEDKAEHRALVAVQNADALIAELNK